MINNSEALAIYKARYPKGTILKLTAPVEDLFTPKEKGERFQVEYIDDALQIHGKWLDSGGSMALVIGVDCFNVIKSE